MSVYTAVFYQQEREKMKEPKQTDTPYKENNKVILMQVMNLLYETYITETETAASRGIAIQAVNKMLEDLGHCSAISDIEKTSYSERRRKSEIWNGESEE